MIISNKIQIGNRVSLEPRKKSKYEEERIYYSKILDILDDYVYEIAIPVEQGHIVPLEREKRFLITYYTNTGLYQNECIVKDRYRKNNIMMLCMESMSSMKKFQRREYYRLPCDIEMKYRQISLREEFLLDKLQSGENLSLQDESNIKKELKELQKENGWKNGRIADISGGGVRFKSKEALEKGSDIQMEISLRLPENDGAKELEGVVIESNEQPGKIFEQRIQFKNIDKTIQEAIVKFIFEEQLRSRQKNMM